MKTLSASLLAAVLLTGAVPAAAAQEPLAASAPVLRIGLGAETVDGHTSRGCSFLFLRWC